MLNMALCTHELRQISEAECVEGTYHAPDYPFNNKRMHEEDCWFIQGIVEASGIPEENVADCFYFSQKECQLNKAHSNSSKSKSQAKFKSHVLLLFLSRPTLL